jgi:hypothetical protein
MIRVHEMVRFHLCLLDSAGRAWHLGQGRAAYVSGIAVPETPSTPSVDGRAWRSGEGHLTEAPTQLESGQMLAKVESQATSANPDPSRAKASTLRRPRRDQVQASVAQVMARFKGCARCSLFLADFCLHHSSQEFEAAVAGSEGDRLSLPWDQGMRNGIEKSYGIRIDNESYYVSGLCPECHRTFVYLEDIAERPKLLVDK